MSGNQQDAGRIAILGGGRIGEALLAGLLRGGRPAGDITISELDAGRAAELAERYGVATRPVADAAAAATTVVIAVKPHHVAGLVADIAGGVTPSHLVISVAAGVSAGAIEAVLPDGVPVVRCMPNTPALIGEGMTAIAAGSRAGDVQLAVAEELLGAVGRVVRVPESQLDAVTALSGSGPAYFFFVIEAMIDAGVLLGLPRPVASELVIQTAAGSAAMLRDTGEHPVRLREAVTSPGGTTAAGLRALESHGVTAAIMSAVEAAARRSGELGG